MTTTARTGRLLLIGVTAFALTGCAAMRRQEARNTEDLLTAAGFTAKPADTSQRAATLRQMPPLKLVAQPKEGHMMYRYADPYSCDCLYVGDQQAYAQYKTLALEQKFAEERVQAAEAEEMDFWGPEWW